VVQLGKHPSVLSTLQQLVILLERRTMRSAKTRSVIYLHQTGPSSSRSSSSSSSRVRINLTALSLDAASGDELVLVILIYVYVYAA